MIYVTPMVRNDVLMDAVFTILVCTTFTTSISEAVAVMDAKDVVMEALLVLAGRARIGVVSDIGVDVIPGSDGSACSLGGILGAHVVASIRTSNIEIVPASYLELVRNDVYYAEISKYRGKLL